MDMRKLVLYSDQGIRDNDKVDARLLSLINKPNPKFGYIPSCGDKERKFFYENCEYYRRLGVKDFLFFDLGDEFNPSQKDELLSCDLIHLSGGDPLSFIKNIKERDFVDVFRDFTRQGGILAGVSGGCLQLTRSVALYKTFIGDLDAITLDDYIRLRGLNLVDFEFLPHYNRWNEDFIDVVKRYSVKFNSVIYACRDGDGILVHDDEIEFIGNIIIIENGLETMV